MKFLLMLELLLMIWKKNGEWGGRKTINIVTKTKEKNVAL